MPANNLSIIAFSHNVKNRGIYRIGNMFWSLRAQKGIAKFPEIILVDVSNDGSLENIKTICQKYNVLLLHSAFQDGQPWSKTLALNCGLKQATKAYTMFTDIDYIFSHNFLKVAYSCGADNRFLMCFVRDSKKKHAKLFQKYNKRYYKSIYSQSSHNPYGVGACQFASTSWFRNIHGYDERMKMWGNMDPDIVRRAKAAKKKIINLQKYGASIIHQWHPIIKNKNVNWRVQWKKNHRLIKGPIVRNTDGDWGQLHIDYVGDFRK